MTGNKIVRGNKIVTPQTEVEQGKARPALRARLPCWPTASRTAEARKLEPSFAGLRPPAAAHPQDRGRSFSAPSRASSRHGRQPVAPVRRRDHILAAARLRYPSQRPASGLRGLSRRLACRVPSACGLRADLLATLAVALPRKLRPPPRGMPEKANRLERRGREAVKAPAALGLDLD